MATSMAGAAHRPTRAFVARLGVKFPALDTLSRRQALWLVALVTSSGSFEITK